MKQVGKVQNIIIWVVSHEPLIRSRHRPIVGSMKTITIAEAKKSLGHYLKLAAAGEEIVGESVSDRVRGVAACLEKF